MNHILSKRTRSEAKNTVGEVMIVSRFCSRRKPQRAETKRQTGRLSVWEPILK